MKIDCVGCLHGHHPKLEGGDLLIVTGDLTARDHLASEWVKFYKWMHNLDYKYKVIIGGNHDNMFQTNKYEIIFEHWKSIDSTYLCNSETEFEGLKIWGTPHSLLFDGVNPRCTAFMGTEEELKKEYDKIPEDIDILISHTPPHGILDMNKDADHCGSIALRETMMRVKPKYLICSHIHEQGGKEVDLVMTKVINCSYVNERYQPVNKVMRIVL